MAEHENTFTHDNHIYDLTKARRLLVNKKAFLLPIRSLLWVLQYDTPDEKRVVLAKHRYPLIVTKWRGKWTVVDGLHRLEKYRRKRIKVIPVIELTPEMLTKCKVK